MNDLAHDGVDQAVRADFFRPVDADLYAEIDARRACTKGIAVEMLAAELEQMQIGVRHHAAQNMPAVTASGLRPASASRGFKRPRIRPSRWAFVVIRHTPATVSPSNRAKTVLVFPGVDGEKHR